MEALMAFKEFPMYLMQKGYNGMVDYRILFGEMVNYIEERY
jgi:hypothetical protein